jgi:uncharacterized membrane protein
MRSKKTEMVFVAKSAVVLVISISTTQGAPTKNPADKDESLDRLMRSVLFLSRLAQGSSVVLPLFADIIEINITQHEYKTWIQYKYIKVADMKSCWCQT